MAIAYGWEAVLQAVIDPGWYSLATPAGHAMRTFRYAIPVIFAGIITFVLLPWNAIAAQVPLILRILLSASPLAYYLVWASYDVMLKASATSLRNAQHLWRWDVWGDAHGSVKNTLVFLNQYVQEPDADLDEIRSLARNALIVVDDFRSQLVGNQARDPADGAVSNLWRSVVRAVGTPRRVSCVLDDESAQVRLSSTDYQVAQRVLPDLLSNALKAGASIVSARCAVSGQPAKVQIEITDNGVGLSEDELRDPQTSLRMLRARLRERQGDLWHSPNAAGGTTAVARWRADGVLESAGLMS